MKTSKERKNFIADFCKRVKRNLREAEESKYEISEKHAIERIRHDSEKTLEHLIKNETPISTEHEIKT